ncbi:hypothetical protein [Tropicimonas marinistellae]|uniref:hypothetical protein n=1 Tax=Tropicimonas marinistellae TaxID=1739787 RepID=UPI000836E2D6|nr:hypothetical protein [Tropicimonas marinistellae]
MRLVTLICAFLLPTAPAIARSPIADVICAPTDEMREKLLRQFGEVQQGTGLRGPDQVMELWSGASGDWTLVMTYASGQSCIVAMGEHWDGPVYPREG